MKLLLAFALTLSTVISLRAQQAPVKEEKKDTIYVYNESGYWLESNRKSYGAIGYYIKKETRPYHYVRKIIYLDEPKLMASFRCYDQKYANADSTEVLVLNVKDGAYEERYHSGQTKIICTYLKDSLDGDFKFFYPNGQLKRHDLWKSGTWLEGKCFNEAGEQVPYYKYRDHPEFVGGKVALYKYLLNSIVYPKEAREKGDEGSVFVAFTVGDDGSIFDVHIRRGVTASIDNEALRVVKAMPKWKAAQYEGESVKVTYVLPIRFKLSD